MDFTPDFPANEAEVNPKHVAVGGALLFFPIVGGAVLTSVFDGSAIWLILGLVFVCGFMGLCIMLDRTAYTIQPAYRRVRKFRTGNKKKEEFLPITDDSWVSIHRNTHTHKGREYTAFPITLHLDRTTEVSLYPQKDHLAAQKFAEQVAQVLHIGVRDHIGTELVETDHKLLGRTLKERIKESGESMDFGLPPAHADFAIEAGADRLRLEFPIRGSINPWGMKEAMIFLLALPGMYFLLQLDSKPHRRAMDLQEFLIIFLPGIILVGAIMYFQEFKKNEYEGRSEELLVEGARLQQTLKESFRTRHTSLDFSEIKNIEVVEGKVHKVNDQSGVGHLVVTGQDAIMVVGNGTDLESLHWLRSALRTAIARG